MMTSQMPLPSPHELGASSVVVGSSPSTTAVPPAAGRTATWFLPRSASMDRRLCEAAQFAEAVGDANVAQEIHILDDDDDRFDEEEEDEEEEEGVGCLSSRLNPVPQQATDSTRNSALSFVVPMRTETNTPKRKRRLRSTEQHGGFLDQLPIVGAVMPTSASCTAPTSRAPIGAMHSSTCNGSDSYVYKGLQANPPERVLRGTQQGNYAQLHRKAWLEVSDPAHRYGKNLRFYYRHWENLGCPTNVFFDWLDSRGESAGQPLPDILECPRARLDADTVLYITDPDVTEKYALTILLDDQARGRIVNAAGDPIVTGPDGWIFVLRDNRMYGGQKITSVKDHQTKERFHHSSFFGGKAVAAAGIFITNEHGFLARLYPHSGHYRPREAHTQCVLLFLYHLGVDLRTFDVDMQQILHVSRDNNKNTNKDSNQQDPTQSGEHSSFPREPPCEKKKKKVDSLFLTPAIIVACFLAHKARLIGSGLMKQIHQLETGNATTVRQALELLGVDE